MANSTAGNGGGAELQWSDFDSDLDQDDELQIYDVVTTAGGDEFAVLSASEVHEATAEAVVDWRGLRGGFSAVGYMVVERHAQTGVMSILRKARWLRLDPPPSARCAECDEADDDLFGWAELSPAACRALHDAPAIASLLIGSLIAGGLAQLAACVRRTRQQRRIARAHLLRGALLLSAAMPARVCTVAGGVERCDATAMRRRHANQTRAAGGNLATANHSTTERGPQTHARNATVINSTSGGKASLAGDGVQASAVSANSRRPLHQIEYGGYEDARVLVRPSTGQMHLLAGHEDCMGRRRLALVSLAGDAMADVDSSIGADGLQSEAIWTLHVDEASGGTGLALADTEKNWSPFVYGDVLYLSYALQPHVVLRCAWTGGYCRVAYESSSAFLSSYEALKQGLRGGTPYVRLTDGTYLGAMHVKDSR